MSTTCRIIQVSPVAESLIQNPKIPCSDASASNRIFSQLQHASKTENISSDFSSNLGTLLSSEMMMISARYYCIRPMYYLHVLFQALFRFASC